MERIFANSLYAVIKRPAKIRQNPYALIDILSLFVLKPNLVNGISYTHAWSFPVFLIGYDLRTLGIANYISTKQHTGNNMSLSKSLSFVKSDRKQVSFVCMSYINGSQGHLLGFIKYILNGLVAIFQIQLYNWF